MDEKRAAVYAGVPEQPERQGVSSAGFHGPFRGEVMRQATEKFQYQQQLRRRFGAGLDVSGHVRRQGREV
jgi:hypothetical protein